MLDLPIQYTASTLERLVACVRSSLQFKGGFDGRHRIAELMAKHGQEFILASVLILEFKLPGPDLLLKSPTFGDIVKHKDYADECSLRIANGCARVVDMQFGVVFPDQDGMVRQSDNDPLRKYPSHRILNHSPCLFIDNTEDFFDGSTKGVFEVPAGLGLGNGVQEADGPVDIGDDHAIAYARQSDPEPLALVDQFEFSPPPQIDFMRKFLDLPIHGQKTAFSRVFWNEPQ